MTTHKRILSFLINRYKLRRSVLWKYRKAFISKVSLFPGSGRPKFIDSESTTNIKRFVRSESPSKEQFKEALNGEHVLTVKRRRPDVAEEEIKEVSVRSLGRYI